MDYFECNAKFIFINGKNCKDKPTFEYADPTILVVYNPVILLTNTKVSDMYTRNLIAKKRKRLSAKEVVKS